MQHFLHLGADSLTFESCCEAEGKLWFFANEFNALCNMDVYSHKVKYIESIPSENIFSKYLCASIKYSEGKLFLTPRGAKCISIYDIRKREFEEIELDIPVPYDTNPYVNWLKFISSIIVGESLYMIPRSYPAIIEMSLRTYKQIYHVQWLSDIKDKIVDQDSFFWSDCIIKDKELILASSIANIIFSFNTETKSYTVLYSGDLQQCYSGMAMVGKNILLSDRKSGRLKLWNLSQNLIADYGEMPENFVTKKIIGFSNLMYVGKSIFAIPLWANMLLKITPQNTEIQMVKNYDGERGKNDEIAICCAWTTNGRLYCMNNLSKCIDVFDEDGNTEGSFQVTIADDFCEQMENTILFKKNLLFGENELFPMRAYIKYLSLSLTRKLSDRLDLRKEILIGEEILRNLK